MNFLLILGLMGPVTQIEKNKVNAGMTKSELIHVMGQPISIGQSHTSFTHDKTETYTFKSSTHCTSYADVCSVIIRYNKVWKFLDVRPEYLASK